MSAGYLTGGAALAVVATDAGAPGLRAEALAGHR